MTKKNFALPVDPDAIVADGAINGITADNFLSVVERRTKEIVADSTSSSSATMSTAHPDEGVEMTAQYAANRGLKTPVSKIAKGYGFSLENLPNVDGEQFISTSA